MMFLDTPLQVIKTTLKTYLGEPFRVMVQREVRVIIAKQTVKSPLNVVAGNGSTPLGSNWLWIVHLNWQVKQCKLPDVLDRYYTVFQPVLGMLEDYEAKIVIDPQAHPRFCKACFVPYAMRAQVEKELDILEAEGIIKTVEFADWGAPIVSVLKSDGKSLRICGDFKMIINSASKVDHYLISKIEDLLANPAGEVFSNLDMSQAYLSADSAR